MGWVGLLCSNGTGLDQSEPKTTKQSAATQSTAAEQRGTHIHTTRSTLHTEHYFVSVHTAQHGQGRQRLGVAWHGAALPPGKTADNNPMAGSGQGARAKKDRDSADDLP